MITDYVKDSLMRKTQMEAAPVFFDPDHSAGQMMEMFTSIGFTPYYEADHAYKYNRSAFWMCMREVETGMLLKYPETTIDYWSRRAAGYLWRMGEYL